MILVTGGLGFIGSHVSRALLDLGERCVIGQRRIAPVPDFLADFLTDGAGERVVVESMDCTDLAGVLAVGERHEITGAVHLAAVGLGGAAPLDELWANTLALFTVLRAAQVWGVTRMVLASTIGVYAGVVAGAYREDMPLPVASAHPIPAFKKSAEILAGAVSGGGLDVVSARIGAIWGPLGRPASQFFAAPRLIHTAVREADTADGGFAEPTTYADDAIDMCYVRDCGRAVALLQTTPSLDHRTYNIGSGRATSNREIADAITRAVPGAAPTLVDGRNPHGPSLDGHLDISRLRADTGYEPDYDLDRAVADYVHWLRAGHPR